MYQVDENFWTCMNSSGKYDEVTGAMTLTDGTTIDLELNSFLQNTIKISGTNVSNVDIVFGVVHSNELTMSIYTDLDRYALYGAEINLVYTVYDHKPDTGVEYISSDVDLGIFTIAEVEKKNDIARITAYDNMKKLDKPCGTTVFSGTPYNILKSVATHTEIPFHYIAEDFEQFLNYSEVVQFDTTSGAKTYRDIVKYTCQMLGVCCRANRTTGGFELYEFSREPDDTITPVMRKLSTTNIADYLCRFNGFSATSVKGTFKDVARGINGITMIIDDAPAWDYGLATSLRDRSVRLATWLRELQYTPCDVSIFNNPIYECGDMLQINLTDGDVNTLVTEFSWSFRSNMIIKSTGSNTILEKTTSEETTRQVVRSSDANKLVSYDVTTLEDIEIGDEESANLCNISFNSAQQTHCMWLANILVSTEADSGSDYTDLKVTYTYDGNEVVFYPQEHYVDGNHTFSLFYPISEVTEQTVHTWKVDITAENGTATILTGDFKGSLFGQNLVEQEYWDGILILDDIVHYVSSVAQPITITDSGVTFTIFDPADEQHKLQVINALTDTVNAVTPTNTLITTTESCTITLEYAFDTIMCTDSSDVTITYCGEYMLI